MSKIFSLISILESNSNVYFNRKTPNPLGKKADEEGMFAITWIQSHLEEDPDVSLPKQEVYDEYQ